MLIGGGVESRGRMSKVPGMEWHLKSELVPSRDEMTKVLDLSKITNPRDFVFFTTGSHTGLRVCELAHLKTPDLVNGKVRVVRRKKRTLQESTMEVSKAVWKLLSEWAQMFDGYLFPGNSGPCVIHRSKDGVPAGDERVCNGGHIHIRTMQLRWRLMLSMAGLYSPGRGIHQTRHFFATELYRATRDLRATQVALAHSSSSMTERYAHVVDLQEKINLVQPVF